MKLLIIDDHPLLRDGLVAWLQQAAPEANVLQAKDAREGFDTAERNEDLDVILLDLELPGLKGIEALAEFNRRYPNIPVIVLSTSEDPRHVRDSLASGALGYVPKSASQQVLLAAIRLVMNGDLYVPPLILSKEMQFGDNQSEVLQSSTALSQRQIEILRLLSAGLPNKSIAKELGLSIKTVKTHISAIFKALDVVNRTQAAAAGRDAGLI
jgi:two-component system, NarL family, nitrate/nitrite response regulator NarL